MEQNPNPNAGLEVLTDVVPAGTTIQLPNHFDENGNPVKLQINQDIRQKDLQQQLDIHYPNDVNALARQMAFGSPDQASRVTQEQFNDVLDAASAKEEVDKVRGIKSDNPGFFALAGNVLPHIVSDITHGLVETAKQVGIAGMPMVGGLQNAESFKQQSYAVAKLVEGVAEGTEQFANATELLARAGLLQQSNVNKYAMYNIAKDMELNDQQRKAGDTLLFGQNPEIGASAALTKNVLDLSLILPGVAKLAGGLSRAGTEVAAQSIKALAEETGVGMARQLAGNVMAATGDKIAAGANATQVLTSSLKKGIGVGGQVAAGLGAIHVAEENPYLAGGLALLAVGAPAIGSVVGKGMQFAGKALATDSAVLAGREILQQGSRNAAEDFAIRTALSLTPPDSVVRTIGSVLDSSVHGAAIGGGLAYGQAMSDPFASAGEVAQNTIVGAVGGAAAGMTLSGATHLAFRPEFSKGARDLNYARNVAADIQSRPNERSVIIDNQEIKSNDKDNRINLLVRSDIPTGDKARINSVLRSAEAAGHDVIFVNNDTALPDMLGGRGEQMGKGVVVSNDASTGKSTIIINSDKITPASAIEEVSHAVIGDQMATDILKSLMKEGGGISGALDKLTPFADRYISTQRESNPAAADALKAKLDIAKQTNISENERMAALLPIVHEYAAMGSGEMLKGRPPELLETGISRNVWINAAHNVQSSLGMLPSGATKDPITGFFWKDGKITDDKVLQGVSKNISDFIKSGRAPVGISAVPSDVPIGTRRTAGKSAEPPKTGYEPGDIAPDGGRVVGEVPHVRYEDKVVDQKTGQLRQSKKSEQDKIHGDVFKLASKILGTENIDPQRWEQGIYGGNVSVGNGGKPIIYKDTPLSTAELMGLFSLKDHFGNFIIKPENQQHVELLNASIGTGNIVNLDSVVNLNRNTSNRDYKTRVNGKALILGFQQTPKGGIHVLTYDLSLLDNLINHERGITEVINKALKEYKINSLDDAVPYVKAYLENLSQSQAMPSAFKLALVAPDGASATSATVLRDVFHLAGGLDQRAESTTDRLLNQPLKERFEGLVEPGRPRDQSVFNNRRLDDILGASLYQPEGSPVSIKVDKSKMISRYRANFSPDTSPVENLGDSKVITDPIAKERIIVNPNGKATLFLENGRKVVLASEQEAIDYSNKELAKSRARFSPSSREDMPEGPVFTREQAQQRIDSAADWEFVSMLKDRDKNQKRIERTYNRFLTSDKSSKRIEALNNAVDVIQENAGIKIDKNKFPFYTERGGAPALYREMQQSISKAYPELTDLFKLGELEHQVQGKKSFGMSLDLFPVIEGRETYSMKIGREMSELTDKIVQKFKGKISNADALKKATQVYDSITNVFSKTERDLVTDKINNEFIALVDATRPSSGGQNVRFSPDTEGYQRYTAKEKKQLEVYIRNKDIRDGTAFKELWAAHDAMLRGRQETEGGDIPAWVQAKEIRSDIERESQTLMRKRRKMAQTIREDSIAWQAEDKPPVYDPELIEPSKGRKPKLERRQMSQSELEAVTEAAGYKPPVGKPAEVRPSQVVKPGTTLKSLQDLTGLQTYAPSPKAEAVVAVQAAPTTRPNVTDLISQKRVPFRVIPIKTETVTGFLKELSGSKSALYEQAVQQQMASEPTTYTEPRKAATPPPLPPKQTAVEGLVSAIDDPAIPPTHIIQPMPSGKFKVWSVGRQVVDAITESYQDAVKAAQIKRQAEQKVKSTRMRRYAP
jgi:hypothetical protein